MVRVTRVLAAAGLLGVLAAAGLGCGGGKTVEPGAAPPAPTPSQGAVPWPAPPDPIPRMEAAGLTPERKETLVHHVHAHLDVFVNGAPVVVPAGIGIDISDPGVQSSTAPDGSKAYGGIELCDQPCISPLHTHDASGEIHTESASSVPNNLGEFFTEWGVELSGSCVGGYCRPASIQIFVDGDRFDGDPRAIELTDRKEIAIVIGSPPDRIPGSADSGNA